MLEQHAHSPVPSAGKAIDSILRCSASSRTLLITLVKSMRAFMWIIQEQGMFPGPVTANPLDGMVPKSDEISPKHEISSGYITY